MKSFHKTMGYLSAIFLLMIIVSISVASSYMKDHDISFPQLFSNSGEISYNSTRNLNFWDSGNKASNYETLNISESETFDLAEEIFISASIEEVTFIEDDRNDILVEYYRELPNTKNYEVTYKASASDDKLSIFTTLKIKNISIDKAYDGTIKIYVPIDYTFEKVTIDSGAAKITSNNIYTNTKSLSTIASFGDIDIEISSPIDEVLISCNFGSVDVQVNDIIKELDVTCDMGKINLTINDKVDILTVNEDLGDVVINATSPLGSVEITNSMGSIKADFLESVKEVVIENNMGDIDANFYKNDNISIYIDTDLGSIHSDFPTTASKDTNYKFSSDMGSIKVQNN